MVVVFHYNLCQPLYELLTKDYTVIRRHTESPFEIVSLPFQMTAGKPGKRPSITQRPCHHSRHPPSKKFLFTRFTSIFGKSNTLQCKFDVKN